MVSTLKTVGAKQSDSLDQFLSELVCDPFSQRCMHGMCNKCKFKRIEYEQKTKEKQTQWDQWRFKTEKRKIKTKQTETEKEVTFTVKETQFGTVADLVDWLEKGMERFKRHYFNIRHQYKYLRNRKELLKDNECIIQIDFSENYLCKHSDEVQSMHFGASKKQLSLQTGAYFLGGDKKAHTFCTVSEHLNHGPGAIWSHLRPILKLISEEHPDVDTVEFFSDGPTAQYRQKGNFHLMTTKPREFGFRNVSWSFFEAGHGKGLPDAVGGAVKRRADTSVKYGKSITSADEFLDAIKDSKVQCLVIPREDVDKEICSINKENLQAIKGTLKLHQVHSVSRGVISYRDISCTCYEPNECLDHKLKKATLLQGSSDKKTEQNNKSEQSENKPKKKDKSKSKQTQSKPKKKDKSKSKQTQGKPDIASREMKSTEYQFDCFLTQLNECKSIKQLQAKCKEIQSKMGPLVKERQPISFDIPELYPDIPSIDMMPTDLQDTRTLYPCTVKSDGNCLPSCGSVFAFGTIDRTSEIRVRMVCELVLNEDKYLQDYLSKGVTENPGKLRNWPYLYTQYSDMYIPGMHLSDQMVQTFFRLEVLQIRKDKSFMGIWQMHALAEILNTPVYSVYPQLGEGCVRQDYNRLIMSSCDTASSDTPVSILWTTTRTDMSRTFWRPNHFVPLVLVNAYNSETAREQEGPRADANENMKNMTSENPQMTAAVEDDGHEQMENSENPQMTAAVEDDGHEQMEKQDESVSGNMNITSENIKGYLLNIPDAKQCIGKYVVVDYNGVPYPGIVKDSNDTHALIQCMHRVTKLEENDFFWPRKLKDIDWYDQDDIVALIPESTQICGSSHFKIHPVAWQDITQMSK